MKTKILNFLLTLTFAFFAISCEKDNDENLPQGTGIGEVQFGFQMPELSARNNSSSRTIDPNLAAVVFSITDLNGDVIYNNETIELYHLNGSYISRPISLVEGNYNLTEFFIVDQNNQVIYVAPIEGSKMDYLVNDPLAIDIKITKDTTIKTTPEVISAADFAPEDFGYTTFSFEEIKTLDFLVATFAYDETTDNFELTDSYLTVYDDTELLYEGPLSALTNEVRIRDEHSAYEFTVTKTGYETYTHTYTLDEIKAAANDPIEIILWEDDPSKVYSSFLSTTENHPSGEKFVVISDKATVQGSHAGTNGGKPFVNRNYIKYKGFDAIPSGAVVDSAFLELTYHDDVRARIHCEAYGVRGLRGLVQRITSDYDENTSYANRPDGTTENQAILPDIMDYQPNLGRVPETFEDQKFKIDITDLTQDMVDKGNYGIMIRMENETQYRTWHFYSFTHPEVEKRAKIRVYWH